MKLIKHHCFLQLKRKNVEISDEQKGQNHHQNDSTGKLLNQGQYREKVEFVRVPENCPDEYRKMI